ncbi:MAG: hypothetical protein ACLFS9_09720, partial [Nitriliruptoraceae bacterium]
MRQPRLRWFASLLALAMIATACGGADDTDTTELEDTEDAATEEGGDDDGEDTGDEGDGDAAGGAPADAQLVIDRSFDLRTNDPHRQFEATGT